MVRFVFAFIRKASLYRVTRHPLVRPYYTPSGGKCKEKCNFMKRGPSGSAALAYFAEFWYNAVGCLCPPWQQGGGEEMITLADFIMAVVANVIGYYICKWLDRHNKGN